MGFLDLEERGIKNRNGYKSHPRNDSVQFSLSPLLVSNSSVTSWICCLQRLYTIAPGTRVLMQLRVPTPVLTGLSRGPELGVRVWVEGWGN